MISVIKWLSVASCHRNEKYTHVDLPSRLSRKEKQREALREEAAYFAISNKTLCFSVSAQNLTSFIPEAAWKTDLANKTVHIYF